MRQILLQSVWKVLLYTTGKTLLILVWATLEWIYKASIILLGLIEYIINSIIKYNSKPYPKPRQLASKVRYQNSYYAVPPHKVMTQPREQIRSEVTYDPTSSQYVFLTTDVQTDAVFSRRSNVTSIDLQSSC